MDALGPCIRRGSIIHEAHEKAILCKCPQWNAVDTGECQQGGQHQEGDCHVLYTDTFVAGEILVVVVAYSACILVAL